VSRDWIPGGRKFALCVLVWIGATALKFCKLLDDSSYVTLISISTGAFMVSNVAQDYRPPRPKP